MAAACHVQLPHTTTTGTRLHRSSDATPCKHSASFTTRWPSGRGLPAPQQTSGAQANSPRSCQLQERERASERRGRQRQQVGGSTGEIRPTAWLSGWQGGCTVGSGITLHRCADSGTEQHLCPPRPHHLTQRQDSQMLAKLQRTHTASCSLKSDQNNHR